MGGWAFLVGTAALVCTQSHGGLLALMAVLAIGVLYLVQKWKARILAFAIASSLIGAVYAVVQFAGFTRVMKLQEFSFVGRLLLWDAGWRFFVSSPLFGIGWQNFQVLPNFQFISQPSPGLQSSVESLYLQLLSETGLLGFVTFFLLLFLAFRAARKGLRSRDYPLGQAIAFGVLGAVVVMLVQGITEAQLEVPQLGTMLWILLALFAVSERVCDRNESCVAGRGGPHPPSQKSSDSPDVGTGGMA